jgi:hypothetical protein
VPPPIVKEQKNSQIKKFLKNIEIRAASTSGMHATAVTRRMTVRVDLGVASILIPKQFKTESGIASFLIPKKTVQNTEKNSKRNQGVASFLIPKSFHI